MHFKNPPTYDGKNLLTTTQAGNLEMAQSATIGDTYTFGPGTLNSFHFTFNRRRDNRGPTPIPDQPDAARRQHVQRGAELPAVRRYRRLQHVLRHLRSWSFQRQHLSGGRRCGRDSRTASNGIRVQPRPGAEQHRLRFQGEWELHLQRFADGPGAGRFHDRAAERLHPDQRHSRRPAEVDHELLRAGHIQDIAALHGELRHSLGADVLRSGQIWTRYFLQT